MYQQNAQLAWIQVGIVGQDPAGKVVERAGQFDACESAASNYEGEQWLPQRCFGFTVGPLEHLNDMIADAYGIQQAFEVKRQLLDVRHSQVVRDGTQRKDKMVVGHFKMPGRRVCGHSGNGHPAALKIDRCNAAADELRPMQAAAQWRADMP